MTPLSLCLVKLEKAGYSGLQQRNLPYSDYPTSLPQSLAFLEFSVCVEEGPTQHPLCSGWFPQVLDYLKSLSSSQESHVSFSKYMFLFFKPNPQPPFTECKSIFLSVQSKEWYVILWRAEGSSIC